MDQTIQNNIYDVIVIGSGPAGLTAGIYLAREKMNVAIIEKQGIGGQIGLTDLVENYPGVINDETGKSLSERMKIQAENFGAKILFDEVEEVCLDGQIKEIKGMMGSYKAKAIIIATGTSPRKLGVTGEAEMAGCGVSYCATCDGAFFEDHNVYVVGGGDTAIEEGLFLTKYGRKVTIIHRRDALRASKYLQDKAFANDKIEFLYDTVVEEIMGDGIVCSIRVKNLKTGETKILKREDEEQPIGVFIFVGTIPQTDLFKDKVEMQDGHIVTNKYMETNILGVYAAGDCRDTVLRQIVTAVSDGAVAAIQSRKYIE